MWRSLDKYQEVFYFRECLAGWRHACLAPWRTLVPMQSVPVSPPPITITALPCTSAESTDIKAVALWMTYQSTTSGNAEQLQSCNLTSLDRDMRQTLG